MEVKNKYEQKNYVNLFSNVKFDTVTKLNRRTNLRNFIARRV